MFTNTYFNMTRFGAVTQMDAPVTMAVRGPFIVVLSRFVVAVVEELLASDLVVHDRVHTDFLQDDPSAGGFWGDVEGEVNGELVRCRAVKERAGHGLAVEDFLGDLALGFLDHRALADGFLAVAFN